jgi:hypothetical protein
MQLFLVPGIALEPRGYEIHILATDYVRRIHPDRKFIFKQLRHNVQHIA